MNTTILIKLQEIVGTSYVFTDEENLKKYGHDETEDYIFPPNVVVKPSSVEEIASIMKLANEYKIPVVPIGGQTGLSGGAFSHSWRNWTFNGTVKSNH